LAELFNSLKFEFFVKCDIYYRVIFKGLLNTKIRLKYTNSKWQI